jgi:predicted metal-dependent phosphoesterase TrpH
VTSLWNCDLHSHTLWSKDCLSDFERIIEICQRRGIDRLAITDHNTADGALKMQQLAPDLIIVGEEIMTTQGEILAYFVKETVPAKLTPEETIRRLRDQGAVISVSHPYDRLRKGAWEEADLLRIIDQVDAIEIYNARCTFPDDNRKAQATARKYNKPGTAGSDAHIAVEYGKAMVQMQPFEGASDFLASLRSATYIEALSPIYVHLGSTYAKWMKRLKLRKRMWAGG